MRELDRVKLNGLSKTKFLLAYRVLQTSTMIHQSVLCFRKQNIQSAVTSPPIPISYSIKINAWAAAAYFTAK